MRKPVMFAALLTAAFAAAPAAAAITINFENIGTYGVNSGIQVLDFYNGGTASNGHSGTNLGVSFASNALTLCLNTPGTICSTASRGGAGDPASAFTAMFFMTGSQTSLNDAAGFTTGINFFYAARNAPGTAQIFSGLNGTGSLLASLVLPANAAGCGTPYNALYCPFGLANLPFTGTAHSVVFAGTAGHIGFDDIVLGAVALPEPASWAMMLIGFAAAGAALRRTRRHSVALA
jgi:PEP-CTERM motif